MVWFSGDLDAIFGIQVYTNKGGVVQEEEVCERSSSGKYSEITW